MVILTVLLCHFICMYSKELPIDSAYYSLIEAVKNPQKVVHLSLRHQKLLEMPKELLLMPNLKTLDLGRNYIKEIPTWINQLVGLKELIMDRNDLEQLPPEIGKLVQLEKLDLWNNNLSYFPPELSGLKSLKTLDLRAILINQEAQNNIIVLLPWTKIYFSPACKCKTQ